MNKYYVGKTLLLAFFVGVAVGLIGKSVLAGIVVGLLLFVIALALYSNSKTRYGAQGSTQVDEREVWIDYKAARYSWAFVCTGLGSFIVYFDIFQHQTTIPLQALSLLLVIAMSQFIGLKIWLRRT